MENKYSLILASKSPRRKELLGHLDIPFKIKTSHIDEFSSFEMPDDIVKDIARTKGITVYNEYERLKSDELGKTFFPLIVSSDTIVLRANKIYGKPDSEEAARAMLMELSGKIHNVITGVWIGAFDINSRQLRECVFSCNTEVEFAEITSDMLDIYISTKDSMDKAGSYGIQGPGLMFISRIVGSYSNVVGFPLNMFIDKLKEFLGFSNDDQGKWRALISESID